MLIVPKRVCLFAKLLLGMAYLRHTWLLCIHESSIEKKCFVLGGKGVEGNSYCAYLPMEICLCDLFI